MEEILVSKPFEGTTFWEQLKSHGPKLIIFFKTLGLYFVFFLPSDSPSILAMILKCLPIVSLGFWLSFSANKLPAFSRKILAGLVFSCLGDAFLIWKEMFPHGMGSFAIAQVFYIWAFGFEHPNWTLGAFIFVLNAIGLGILLPSMTDVPVPIIVGLPVYSMLLMTMVWRATARAQSFKDINWSKMCSILGGISFAISDALLGLSMFYIAIPYAQALVMITYYFAQLCITLSVINAESSKTPSSATPPSSPGKVDKRKSVIKKMQPAQ